jgi:hypothetical protein
VCRADRDSFQYDSPLARVSWITFNVCCQRLYTIFSKMKYRNAGVGEFYQQ